LWLLRSHKQAADGKEEKVLIYSEKELSEIMGIGAGRRPPGGPGEDA
jgi:hypothetical protein